MEGRTALADVTNTKKHAAISTGKGLPGQDLIVKPTSGLVDEPLKALATDATVAVGSSPNSVSPKEPTPLTLTCQNHDGASTDSGPSRASVSYSDALRFTPPASAYTSGSAPSESQDTSSKTSASESSPPVTQDVVGKARTANASTPSVPAQGSGSADTTLGFDSQTIEAAIKAVLQQRFGVSALAQLPSSEVGSILSGPLPGLVAQEMQKSASAGAGSNAPAQSSVSPLPTTPLRDGGMSFLDRIEQAKAAVDRAVVPAPFPADALPSEIQLEQNTNLYLNGLGENVTDDELLRMGSEYGEIISHKAIINSETGLCKGYGFIMYARARDAAVAIVELQKKGYQTSFARHESFSAKLRMMSDSRSSNVYISNLPLTMDEQQLEILVSPHQIISRRILSKPDGSSRGVGFIRFQNRDIAQACIDLLHGKRLSNHPHPLQARFADSESQKRLKQDTTLRKIYADLDMGVLRSPSGHNLRPTPMSATIGGPGRHLLAPAAIAHSSNNLSSAMRPTNSEPGHAFHGLALSGGASVSPSSLRNVGNLGLGSMPMSAATSNGSFYPGPMMATPPTPMSPWNGSGGGNALLGGGSDANVWPLPHGGPTEGSGLGLLPAHSAPPQQHFLGGIPSTGWLLPAPRPRGSGVNPVTASGVTSVAVAPPSLPSTDNLHTARRDTTTLDASTGPWGPVIAGNGVAPPVLTDHRAGHNGFENATPDGRSTQIDDHHEAVKTGEESDSWMPRWTTTLSAVGGSEQSPSEHQVLGSLLLVDGNDNGGRGNPANAARGNTAPAIDFRFNNGESTAIPIINPLTGQTVENALPGVETLIGTTRDPASLLPSAALHSLQQRATSGTTSNGISIEQGLRDSRLQSVGSSLDKLSGLPSVTSSISAPACYGILRTDQMNMFEQPTGRLQEGHGINDGRNALSMASKQPSLSGTDQLASAINLHHWP